MKQVSDKKPHSQPGLIATLSAGFELTTHHLWLITLPLFLDIFYWLGPRLSVQSLVEESARILRTEPAFSETISQIVDLASQINLFTSISIPLIGIPALMSGATPDHTPLSPALMEVESVFIWLLLFVGLSLIGLMLTTTYLGLISYTLTDQNSELHFRFGQFLRHLFLSTIRLFLLGLVFVFALFVVWIPLLPIAVILGLITNSLFIVVMLFGFVIVAITLVLAVPAIVFRGRPVLGAVRDSIYLVYNNTMPTVNMLLLVILISSGTNLLWRLADDGSWLTLVSIAGHAFVNTALVTAIFIFYRDRTNDQFSGSFV